MIYSSQIKNLKEKSRIVAKWGARIKNTGLSRNKFCAKHGFSPSNLSHWINGREVPHDSSIDTVEKALQSEGV